MNVFEPFFNVLNELLHNILIKNIDCSNNVLLLEKDVKEIFSTYYSIYRNKDYKNLIIMIDIAKGYVLNYDETISFITKMIQTHIDNIENGLKNHEINNDLYNEIDDFIKLFSVILEYFNIKGYEIGNTLTNKYKELNLHYKLIAEEDADARFNNLLATLKSKRYTIDINSDNEVFVDPLISYNNVWSKIAIATINKKIAKINDNIVSKIIEMNKKFVLKHDKYTDEVSTICQEMSSSTFMTELFECMIYRKEFEYKQKPFFQNYNNSGSKYEFYNISDGGRKHDSAINAIRLAINCLSCIKDYYTYTISFNSNDSDFIHVVEDNDIGYDLNIYFSNLHIVDEKECVNKINQIRVPVNVLENNVFNSFYNNFKAFMKEYIDVKPVSLTMSQATQHSDENKLASLEVSSQYTFIKPLDLHYREQDVIGDMIVSNEKYIRNIMLELCNCCCYKESFIDDELKIKSTVVTDYQINCENIKHRIFMERIVMSYMDSKYHL